MLKRLDVFYGHTSVVALTREKTMSNYLQAPDKIILDLINAANPGLNMQASEVIFGDPVVVAEGARNTSTLITPNAAEQSRFGNQVTVFYNRLNMAAVIGTQDGRIEIDPDNYDAATILEAFNAKYGVQFDSSVIEDLELPTMPTEPGGEVTVAFTSKATSRLTVGAGNITLFISAVDLEDAVLVTDLDGLVYPSETP